jgi:hypothetical protein
MADPIPPAPNDFEAAAAVAAALKDLAKPRQELILRWVAESLGISQQPAPPPAPAPPPLVLPNPSAAVLATPPSQGAVDIASFVAEKQPKTDIQFVTVAAFYYRFKAPEGQRRETINVKVAQDATRLVNRNRLTDPGSTLHNAKKQGYLDSAGAGEFSVNTVGENLVARTLPSSESGSSRLTNKGKKGARVKRTAVKVKKGAKGK